jgi:four helix bundle protein
LKNAASNLEERVSVHGERVIEFCYQIQLDAVSDPLIRQFVRSATSIGANYCEADEAQSKKDFRHKIAICRKETRETRYWLRLIAKACPAHRAAARELWREARELHLIFCAIIRTTDRNLKADSKPAT